MKRLLLIILIIVFSVLITACGDNTNETGTTISAETSTEPTVESEPLDKWNGTVAKKFESGNGSSSNPYRIIKASQLAYLAKTVNEGTTYEGKYIVLENNLDLNNREWTPIGNVETPFKGNFNGNDQTIYNLKVTKLVKYVKKTNDTVFGFAGLFGYCEDATLQNFKIQKSLVSIDVDKYDYDYIQIGTVVGRFGTSTQSNMINVRVSEASVFNKLSEGRVYCGGLIGQATVNQAGWFATSCVQADVSLRSNGENVNYHGGIIGLLHNFGVFDMTDFASYANILTPLYIVGVSQGPSETYSGAIGAIITENGNTSLSNAFSQVNVRHSIIDGSNTGEVFRPRAIIGKNYYNGEEYGSYKFNNLYGYVMQGDSNAILELYYIAINLVEKNCKGVETLPKNHGFNTMLWNVSDASHPVLK